MRHEKIIKRDDGSRVMLVVEFNADYRGVMWRVDVRRSAPGKRKFFDVVDTNDFDYRLQSFPEGRERWATNKMLEHVSKDEIMAAKLELYELLKPKKE